MNVEIFNVLELYDIVEDIKHKNILENYIIMIIL